MRCRVAIFFVVIGILLSFPRWSDAQWEQTGNIKGGWITYIEVSGTNIFVATRKGGVFLSTDNGTTWKAVNSGLPKKIDVQCLAVSGKNLFAGTGSGVFRFTNNGKRWKAVRSGFKNTHVDCLAVSGKNLFASIGRGVFRSVNNGTSWIAAYSGLPKRTYIRCLAASGKILLAGSDNRNYGFINDDYPITYVTLDLVTGPGLFLSTNNGKSWKSVYSGMPEDTYVRCLAVSGTNIIAGTNKGILLSTNNGANWTAVNSGLPRYTWVECLEVSGKNIFAGIEEVHFSGEQYPYWEGRGVFLYTNNGKSWKAVNVGLPEKTIILDLAVSGTNLFAVTLGRGVWRLPLSDLSIEER